MSRISSTGPFLYLPMEIAARELDSRLLIALFAVRHGLEAVVGQKWLLQANMAFVPKGLWIFKTLTPGDAKHMMRARELGHRVAAIDEEMPGLGEGCGRLRWVDRRSVEASDIIFCLGQVHRDAMQAKFPDHAHKLVVAGNPRWDLLRPELRGLYGRDAEAIRAKYGRTILVNTNIGLVNSAKNSADALIRSLARDGRINLSVPEDRDFIDNLKRFEIANFDAARRLVPRLRSEFPDHAIVLRPHPTERLEPYKAELARLERVHVIHEGPAAAWLLASEALVHTSCTTAVEAYALERIAVCYQTIASPLHDYFLSGKLSLVAKSEDEVVAHLRAALRQPGDAAYRQRCDPVFHRFFAAQEGAFSAERIAAATATALGVEDAAGDRPGVAQWRPGWRFRTVWSPSAFQKRIFPDLSEREIEERLEALANAAGFRNIPRAIKTGDGQYHLFAREMEPPQPIKRTRFPFLRLLAGAEGRPGP